jgi:transposase
VWTLQRIRKGRKSLKQKAGRKRKIEGCDLALLLAHIKKNNTATQQVRADYFAKRCILLNRSTIFRTLKREGWTRKIGTKQYFELDIEKARQFLTDNYQLFSSPSCYALDECGFDLREFARYAYSRKGLQAIIKQPGQKGSNLSVILCVQNTNKEPVISYRPVEGGVDAEIFYDFLSNVNFSTNQEDCILLDNAKIHHANKKLKDLGLLSIKELAKLKNITLKYLPSYAPMLNPAELCIQFIKRHVRSCKPKNREEMKYFIEEAIGLLNQHLTKFFRSCRDYFYFAKNEQ